MIDINIVLTRLSQFSAQSEAEKKHFAELLRLLEQKDYVALAEHTQDQKNNLSPAYQQELKHLSPHFVLKTNEDARRRSSRLLHAIHSTENTAANVYEALATGCGIVVNRPYLKKYKSGQSELVTPMSEAWKQALKTSDWSTVNLLIEAGATIDAKLYETLPFDSTTGETLLHTAARNNHYHLLEALLKEKYDASIKDFNGITPLHLACSTNNEKIAQLLLKHHAQPGAIEKTQGFTPFMFACAHANEKLITSMMQAGYRPTSNDVSYAKQIDDDIYNLVKAPYRKRKQEIIQSSGMYAFFMPNEDNLTDLFRQMHIEDKALKVKLKTDIYKIYLHENTILKPLLDLAMMAARGEHRPDQKNFKAIFTSNEDVHDVVPHDNDGVAAGIYTNHNAVYVASDTRNSRQTLGIMLHEIKHFADALIYENGLPHHGDERSEFLAARQQLLDYLTAHPEHAFESAGETNAMIYHSIASIFSSYAPDAQDVEVLVKVPEIIGLLGVKKGYAWLEKYVPKTLEFYEHSFNPACNDYLACQRSIAKVNKSF